MSGVVLERGSCAAVVSEVFIWGEVCKLFGGGLCVVFVGVVTKAGFCCNEGDIGLILRIGGRNSIIYLKPINYSSYKNYSLHLGLMRWCCVLLNVL